MKKYIILLLIILSVSIIVFTDCDSGASKDGTNNTHFGYIFKVDSYSNNSNHVP